MRPQGQQHGHGLPLAAKTARQLGRARCFEQASQSESLSKRLFNTHHQLRRQQGVAAEGKEVIVGADPRQPQNPAKRRQSRSSSKVFGSD